MKRTKIFGIILSARHGIHAMVVTLVRNPIGDRLPFLLEISCTVSNGKASKCRLYLDGNTWRPAIRNIPALIQTSFELAVWPGLSRIFMHPVTSFLYSPALVTTVPETCNTRSVPLLSCVL